MKIKKGTRVRVRRSWHNEGNVGVALGAPVMVKGQEWVPIEWDGQEDPDFHKLAGIETYTAESLLAEMRRKHRRVNACSCGAELVDGHCPHARLTMDVG